LPMCPVRYHVAMANDSNTGQALASLGSAITSPAKIAFVGYVVLVYIGKIRPPAMWEFMLIILCFLAVQIGHDDYLRIVLNKKAQK
jgi:hypothetical protein